MASDAGAATDRPLHHRPRPRPRPDVVAEGVEDPAPPNGSPPYCDPVQGYYLSKALTAQELTNWLSTRLVPRGHTSQPAALP